MFVYIKIYIYTCKVTVKLSITQKDTISLLTLWMDLILYFLQKLKVGHHQVTMHGDVLVLVILLQLVLGGVRAKQN